MPEVKIRKAVRALWARSALSTALLRSNLPDSHFQTDGIATDNNAANIQIFRFCNNSCTFFQQNHQHCYPRAKVEVLIKQGVVLFGTYYRKTKRRNGWKNSLVHCYYYKVERFRNCGSPPFLMMATPSETMMDSLLGTITLPLMSIRV